MMKRIFLIMLFFCVSFFLSGQNIFQGKVATISTEPLGSANIVLYSGGEIITGTTSDIDGNFKIDKLKLGAYTVKVSYIGYNTEEFNITFSPQKTNISKNIVLSEDPAIIECPIVIMAHKETPFAYTKINKEEIEEKNTGQDLPFILQQSPSVVVTSDAGAGVGYTGIRIRGTDLTRINVTLNDVPVNDAESHSVYFVDLPDIASSIDEIKIQRGIGTSQNGAAAFGASINITTNKFSRKPFIELNNSYGSFNTLKNTISFGTGKLKSNLSLQGRLSSITSDGFIDRASSNLKSYYFSLNYSLGKTNITGIITSGKEKTYQAWYGISKEKLENDRTYNPAGIMLDESGYFTGFYDNHTDNYKQNHYQLHLTHDISDKLSVKATGFYTKGNGFYESFKNNEKFSDYGFDDVFNADTTILETNLIQQKWLDNNLIGANFKLVYNTNVLKISTGGNFSKYTGDHFGYIIWAKYASNSFINKPWYKNTGNKTDYNFFSKINYKGIKNFDLYIDLQYRGIDYTITGTHDNLKDITQSHTFSFFNPKAGIIYKLNNYNQIFASFGISNREPNRGVYRDAEDWQIDNIKHETLFDYEIGYFHGDYDKRIEANFFYMNYKNQLIPTGKINNVGDPVLINVPESYRMGLELATEIKITHYLSWLFNSSLTNNKIKNYTDHVVDFATYPYEYQTKDFKTSDISFSPSIIVNNGLVFSIHNDINISFISKYVGKQYIDNTSNETRSLNAYFINNLKFDYTFELAESAKFSTFFKINNIFNEKYETNAWVYRCYFGKDYYESTGYFPQAGRNFTIGVNIKL